MEVVHSLLGIVAGMTVALGVALGMANSGRHSRYWSWLMVVVMVDGGLHGRCRRHARGGRRWRKQMLTDTFDVSCGMAVCGSQAAERERVEVGDLAWYSDMNPNPTEKAFLLGC
jgi:hypothetical protein